MAQRPEGKPVLEQRLFLDLVRTAESRVGELALLLREHDLTPTQYNVLRILRGAGEPLSCKQIIERMLTRLPDVTRLLDRLEGRGLVRRERGADDRRVSLAGITGTGLDLLAGLDGAVIGLHKRQFSRLSIEQRYRLGELLADLRG